MSALLIEPHYFGTIEYFGLLLQSPRVQFETSAHYIKQTYRNRCDVLTPQGVKSMSVPVHFSARSELRDVVIDYQQQWVKVHLGMLRASYGKAAYFDYYFEGVRMLIEKKPRFLMDLAVESILLSCEFLGVSIDVSFTDTYMKTAKSDFSDKRETISAKKSFKKRHFYREVSYFQNFGSNFEPNLSILDCLMNTGPEAIRIVRQSIADQ